MKHLQKMFVEHDFSDIEMTPEAVEEVVRFVVSAPFDKVFAVFGGSLGEGVEDFAAENLASQLYAPPFASLWVAYVEANGLESFGEFRDIVRNIAQENACRQRVVGLSAALAVSHSSGALRFKELSREFRGLLKKQEARREVDRQQGSLKRREFALSMGWDGQGVVPSFLGWEVEDSPESYMDRRKALKEVMPLSYRGKS